MRYKTTPEGVDLCKGHRHGNVLKVRYPTINDAWRAAFHYFIVYGTITTPYKCNCVKYRKSFVYCIPHPNPWSYVPYLIYIGTRKCPQRVTCGGYHLSRKIYSILPS